MKKLDNNLLSGEFKLPEALTVHSRQPLPEKVLQFGEGNFLRGFADWLIQNLNSRGLFNGSVVVAQPIERGLVDVLNSQDGLYTLYLRGIQDGKVVEQKEILSSISRGLNPYTQFDEYMKCAENPDLRAIISNTTEAGIAYNPKDRPDDKPPVSYPGKLTVFLYKRYQFFKGDLSKGFIILPCELIDRNGENLKRIVLQYAAEWGLGDGFIQWLHQANHFLTTLVDRIVTGYPRDEINTLREELGYEDALLDTAEYFHLWVIEGDKKLAEELPFDKAGLNVIWTDNLTPYRDRKVRILNGAHTMTVLAAYLYGKDTVKECMDDPLIHAFMNRGLYREIIPTLNLPEEELKAFAAAVSERFSNPFIKHYLLSISLNSTSKFKARVLPSLQEYFRRTGKLPQVMTFSLAALMAFYRGTEIMDNSLIGNRPGNTYKINDDLTVLELFRGLWSAWDGTAAGIEKLVNTVLSHEELWGLDLNTLPGFGSLLAGYLYKISTDGMSKALQDLMAAEA